MQKYLEHIKTQGQILKTCKQLNLFALMITDNIWKLWGRTKGYFNSTGIQFHMKGSNYHTGKENNIYSKDI
jgi:cell division protein ZapA (FtsZ GTPase activity inhibitor)